MIRKAVIGDSKTIAACLFLALGEIVHKFIGDEDEQKAFEFLQRFVETENNQYSYQNCWVAETEGRIVAALNLYNGADLHSLRRPVIEYVREKFNKDFNPEDETQAGEYYIDCLGVLPELRNRGTGTRLLQFAIDEYADRELPLGLLVDEDNFDAKRLYLKLGFRVVGKKVLVGKTMDHLQRQPGNS